jgi:hypothetical protein
MPVASRAGTVEPLRPGDGIDKAGDEGHPEQGDQGEQFQFHP